eukprot:CAMPEP_0201570434 /NCGR_PEP_ID=MMETSP0190_2-20130828/12710_1 /ASSEMBLY_ACC=CAM_ASM_000263 /TAXON_ID=37353 /ORGANISM="Rosalina sp." /LENGTH=90 /DNA_ID=CAMNT_0047993989 /DNA_START=292 /DNA_END=564 /DNA_ORIENTATION=+
MIIMVVMDIHITQRVNITINEVIPVHMDHIPEEEEEIIIIDTYHTIEIINMRIKMDVEVDTVDMVDLEDIGKNVIKGCDVSKLIGNKSCN